MACLQIYRELSNLPTFLRVHSNSKEVSYLSWQNAYPNLKTTCHIKLKFFSWTKLIEKLLLAKYLMSVTAPLRIGKYPQAVIGNTDERPVFFNMLDNKSFAEKHVTVVLIITARGYILPLMIIFPLKLTALLTILLFLITFVLSPRKVTDEWTFNDGMVWKKKAEISAQKNKRNMSLMVMDAFKARFTDDVVA